MAPLVELMRLRAGGCLEQRRVWTCIGIRGDSRPLPTEATWVPYLGRPCAGRGLLGMPPLVAACIARVVIFCAV